MQSEVELERSQGFAEENGLICRVCAQLLPDKILAARIRHSFRGVLDEELGTCEQHVD